MKYSIKISLKQFFVLLGIIIIFIIIIIGYLFNNKDKNNIASENNYVNSVNKNYNEDNKKLAEYCYINSKNKLLNNIINSMLDSMAQQHTIAVVDYDYSDIEYNRLEYYDLSNYISMEAYIDNFDQQNISNVDIPFENMRKWIVYGKDMSILYSRVLESIYGVEGDFFEVISSDEMIKNNMLSYLLYYKFLENPDNYEVEIQENTDTYIIRANHYGEIEIYIIDKEKNLLLRTRSEKEENGQTVKEFVKSKMYFYTDKDITVPKEVIDNTKTVEHLNNG